MSLALVNSRARAGVSAPPVRVEVHLSGGLPSTQIVGLPEAAVRESRDRVRAAILCAQFEFPTRRITVNLAPADLPKDGGRFDLPIALGILAASGQIRRESLADYEFLGELSLTGELRAVDGVLPAALAVAASGRTLVVPEPSGAEAALARQGHAFTGRTLLEVCALLEGRKALPAAVAPPPLPSTVPDMADVRGQAHARRALEVAAAGGHHLLLIGSPGCGKTLLASRLPGLLPEASDAEAMESAAIASVSGRGLDPARWRQRPYRAPHHTASAVALVGGGAQPRPGEISLAHNGVLFMDELPEWSRAALEVLREPLESGTVTVSRAARTAEFPARFQLVAAMFRAHADGRATQAVAAAAGPTWSGVTAADCRARCWTVSTCMCTYRDCRRMNSGPMRRTAKARPPSRPASSPRARASRRAAANRMRGWANRKPWPIAGSRHATRPCSSVPWSACSSRRAACIASCAWPAPSPTWPAARPSPPRT